MAGNRPNTGHRPQGASPVGEESALAPLDKAENLPNTDRRPLQSSGVENPSCWSMFLLGGISNTLRASVELLDWVDFCYLEKEF